MYNYAFWTSNAEPIRKICRKECKFCVSAIEAIDQANINRYRITGGQIHTASVIAEPGDATQALIVNTVINQDNAKTLTAEGDVIASSTDKNGIRMEMAVRWNAGNWMLLAAHVSKNTNQ
jgi:hypothetical protein